MNENKKKEIRAGFQSGFSIAFGFIPIAMTFGILAKSAGTSLLECMGFSAIVYAGASQFMAIELLKSGAGIASIVFTTLLFNFRHFIMGASMSTKLDEDSMRWRPIMAFWMTDETYSIAYLKQEKISASFYIPMAMTAYLSLSLGSFLGFQLGSVLPSALNQSMGVALYAMFLAILTPEIKKSLKIFGVVATSGAVNMLVHRLDFVPMGWHIIIVIVLTVGIWTLLDRGEGKCEVSCCE
ncbi:4-azaleucine resistance probable transporter AzlC [Peptoclostridium litorale DSM 5388]|uniref:AzlC family protein n=1 Tax=Peptoclostridium litorale DSM 5388 TaxID=1121324 RepID=A0A069RER9_PEPLI|nr:AzlC family ABC transporter permease [Peptoclostridium litorale]KDR95521.1 AzlC family protein [Peptoclostridium litorale DSM 5388]SIO16912.1 4-azaleucine resistance probable transporter AzlC [Peptoclostridium litorale DSM 5388]